nr:MAG TPA: hypothetical protein [Caudoviricetes sp.]
MFTSYDAVLTISLPKGTTISDRLFVVMKHSNKAVRLLVYHHAPRKASHGFDTWVFGSLWQSYLVFLISFRCHPAAQSTGAALQQ